MECYGERRCTLFGSNHVFCHMPLRRLLSAGAQVRRVLREHLLHDLRSKAAKRMFVTRVAPTCVGCADSFARSGLTDLGH